MQIEQVTMVKEEVNKRTGKDQAKNAKGNKCKMNKNVKDRE
jgi:hypothetical protein